MKLKLNKFLPLLMCFSTLAVNAEELDVLILYTEAARDLVGKDVIDDRIKAYIDAANDSYDVSEIDIDLVLAQSALVTDVDDTGQIETVIIDGVDTDVWVQNYTSEDCLSDLWQGLGDFDEVPELRDTFGADFVVLLRDIGDTGGLGYMDQGSDNFDVFAYSVVRIQNPLSTVTHELGHNMGLSHSRRQDGRGFSDHATGFGIEREVDVNGKITENGFVTIMAYASEFNWATEIAVISNPDIECDTGDTVFACGIDSAEDDGADGALVLNERKEVYSAYRISPMIGSVELADENFSNCLSGLTDDLIIDFTNLNCSNQEIRSIAGVEEFDSLELVDFENNDIFSLQPLLELPNLEVAIISGNDRAICSHITQLENKLGDGNVIRSEQCFPLVAVLVAINSLLL